MSGEPGVDEVAQAVTDFVARVPLGNSETSGRVFDEAVEAWTAVFFKGDDFTETGIKSAIKTND